MVFEWASTYNLYEYLQIYWRAPANADLTKMPHAESLSAASARLMMLDQAARGLEYLSRHGYVHRDIAARNVHLSDNSVVKISLIDNSRDIYPDDYFRLPGFNESLPVRWLAPEVIQQQQWSSKSDVWSFGCLMWEVFSGGQRPYTGFVDQEVIGLVTSGHVLPRTDQCPAIVYDVMTECWKRPSSSRADISFVCRRLASCQKPLMEAEKRIVGGRPMGVGDQHPAIPGNPLQMTTSSTNPITGSGEYQVEYVIDGPNKTLQSNSVYKYTPASLGGVHSCRQEPASLGGVHACRQEPASLGGVHACRQEPASLGGVHACRQEDGEDVQFGRHPTVLCGSTGKNFEILYRTSAGGLLSVKTSPTASATSTGTDAAVNQRLVYS